MAYPLNHPSETKICRTSSCYRSCQFGGCAPKTPGGARARFQVRWMGAAPPKTPALPRSGTRTGGARAKLGCGFSLRRHLLLSPSLHSSLSSLLLRGTSTDCKVYARGLRRLLAHELSFNQISSIFVFSSTLFLSNFCLTLSRTANEPLKLWHITSIRPTGACASLGCYQ